MSLRPTPFDSDFQSSLQAIEALFDTALGDGADWAELEAPDAPPTGEAAPAAPADPLPSLEPPTGS